MPSSVGEERQIEALLHRAPHKGKDHCFVCALTPEWRPSCARSLMHHARGRTGHAGISWPHSLTHPLCLSLPPLPHSLADSRSPTWQHWCEVILLSQQITRKNSSTRIQLKSNVLVFQLRVDERDWQLWSDDLIHKELTDANRPHTGNNYYSLIMEKIPTFFFSQQWNRASDRLTVTFGGISVSSDNEKTRGNSYHIAIRAPHRPFESNYEIFWQKYNLSSTQSALTGCLWDIWAEQLTVNGMSLSKKQATGAKRSKGIREQKKMEQREKNNEIWREREEKTLRVFFAWKH